MSSDLLAKSNGETLFQHTMAVVDAVRLIVDNLPDGIYDKSALLDELVLAAAFHDVGKAATGFQEMLKGTRRTWDGKRHEIISTAFAAQCTELSEEARIAILTHHRTLPVDGTAGRHAGAIPDDQMPDAETAVWTQMMQEFDSNRTPFAEFWKKVCGAIGRPELAYLNANPLEGFKVNPAWVKQSISSRRGQLRAIPFKRRYHAALCRGLLVTADHMASGHTLPISFPDLTKANIYNGKLHHFQEECRTTTRNAILRAPTGSGKTESSLFWMQANWRTNSRLFYVLPYTASINAMHKRLSRIFGDQNVNVLHSKAGPYLYNLLRNDMTSLAAQARATALTQLSREMYFPIRVCTPHQILRYALRGRGWEQMLAEFPKACFVFDEIHAYDAQMTGLILGAAQMVAKWDARLLFTTATMPNFLEELIQNALGIADVITPNPKDERDRVILDKKRHYVDIWSGGLLSQIDDILRSTEDCPHTLIVCNHVRTAHEVFERCQDVLGNQAVLLHSRFAARDRNTIEEALLKTLPRILVATQVVEVSLDIDFHQAFLEAAPIDALAQRMGRVNRAGKRPPAHVVIMREQVSSHKLYDTEISKQTVEALTSIENPVSEDALVAIANHVYKDGYQGEQLIEFQNALHHSSFEHLEDHLIAGVHQDWADEVFDDADDRIEVLPAYYESEYKYALKEGRWLDATSMLVSLSKQIILRMRTDKDQQGAINDAEEPWVIHKAYDPIKGLRLEFSDDRVD